MTTKLEQYRNSYSYRELVNKHKLDEHGLWNVRGEDSNCDLGGAHYMPDLGTFEGKLEDIIAYAVQLTGFWSWGAGGDIKKVAAPVKITAESNAEQVKLKQREQELLAELEKIRTKLDK